MYQLRDAESYRGQRILVVGGGDSAIEAAVGLVRQPGTKVTLSYRKNAFYRIKRKNQSAIEVLMERNRVRVLFESEVTSIEDDRVTLSLGSRSETIDNDYVFVFAGGEPPFELLRQMGIRFGGDAAPTGAETTRPSARTPGPRS
jgi:thioredoxin reductase